MKLKDTFSTNTNKTEWGLLVLHIVYFVLLLWIYTTYIIDIYGYYGYINAFNINKMIISPFVIAASFVFLRNNGLPSYFFLNVIIASTITPALVMFSGSDLPLSFIVVIWFAFAILAVVARYSKLRMVEVRVIGAKIMMYWLAVLSLLLIATIFAFGGGRFINFDLSLVYEFRRDAAANLPAIFGYLIAGFPKAIFPAGIVLSLLYRKWVLLLVFIFCDVMIFALASSKGTLFVPVVVIFAYWFSRYRRLSHLTMLGLIMVVIVGGLDFYLGRAGFGGIAGWFGDLFVRRALLANVLITWVYYNFFSGNPYAYWANSKFTFGLVNNPYDLDIPELIGREVFGRPDMHANTGWIGSGMANAGYFGIVLYSVLIGLLLSLLDAYAKKLPPSVVVPLFLFTVLTATAGSDFSSLFLTHGLLMLLILVVLLKPIEYANPNGGRSG